jgi:hypothetical protein
LKGDTGEKPAGVALKTFLAIALSLLTIARMLAKIILDVLIYLNGEELLNVRK